MRIIRFCVALLGLVCTTIAPAWAQEKYPNRPVHFIVSFAAGGSNDIIARVLCDWLSDHFGRQFVVENRTGASGNVGAQSVINSAPDGYTVMFVGPNNAISQSVFKKLQFDFNRDTAPVGAHHCNLHVGYGSLAVCLSNASTQRSGTLPESVSPSHDQGGKNNETEH